MTCPNGHPTEDSASFCPTCGAAVAKPAQPLPVATVAPAAPASWPAPAPPPPGSLVPYSASYPAAPPHYLTVTTNGEVATPNTLYLVAAIINWVVLGLIILFTFGFGIVCAAWFVPMTIQMHRGVKSPYKHTALGVCTLLFCNIVSGILLLVGDSGKPDLPR